MRPALKSSEKANFLFASGYELVVASGLGMGPVSTSLSSRTHAGPVHAASASLSSYVHHSRCVLEGLGFCFLCFVFL